MPGLYAEGIQGAKGVEGMAARKTTLTWGRAKATRTAMLIAVYCALLILLAVLLLMGIEKEDAQEETYGSLDGRFTSAITLEKDGQTFSYREMEITNYLLIGVDRSGSDGDAYQSSVQADFLVLLSIDRRNRTITPLMVDRDTMARVTTYGVFGHPAGARQMQICLAQAFHAKDATGSENTMRALSDLLGHVTIDRYIAVDIGGIAILNDALGGVEVTLTDDFTAIDPAMQRGATVLLTGKQAEAFVRGRMTVGDGTNAARMRRQQVYLERLLEKLFPRGGEKGDTETLLEDALHALDGHLETNLRQAEMLSDLQRYAGYTWQPFAAVQGTHTTGADGFTEFWPDEDALTQLIVSLWFK